MNIYYLLEPALLTAFIETPVFALCGYRKRSQWLGFFWINILSNVLLNRTLTEAMPDQWDWTWVFLGELLVLGLEFGLCSYIVHERYARLFATLVLTNLASFLTGFLLYDYGLA